MEPNVAVGAAFREEPGSGCVTARRFAFHDQQQNSKA